MMTLHKNRRHSAHISGWKQIFLHKTCKKQSIITLNDKPSKSCVFKPSLNNTETFQQDDIRKQQKTKGFQPRLMEGLEEGKWSESSCWPVGNGASLRNTSGIPRTLSCCCSCCSGCRMHCTGFQALGENPKEVKVRGSNYCMAVFKIICSVTTCVQVSYNIFIIV